MGSKLGLVGVLLTASSLAWAEEPEATDATRTLDAAADAIADTLRQADAAVGRAAEDLGRTGLHGRQAHERLGSLCEELDYAVTCSALDDQGWLVSEAPAEFTAAEGQSVREQEHVRRMLETRQPVLSDAFRAVEGFDAVVLAHPVFGTDGRFLGSVSMVARPASLIGHAVKPAFPEGLPEIVVLQEDGYQLFDVDPEEIGRNVFTDPMYEDFPEVREGAKRVSKAREGTADVRFLGRGLTPAVHKRAYWTTVELHGAEWRTVVMESLEGGGPPVARYDEPEIPIPAEVGLDALVALSDGHLGGLADDLGLIAAEPDVRSGQWARVEAPLRRVSRVNVPALYFYAKPDGTYWSLDRGRSATNLSDRAYFAEVLEGEPVVGELVVGKTIGRTEAVVAVPVKGDDGEVVGVLGASVFLDDLSAQLRDEMGLGEGLWFYAFDERQRLALHPDPERVFLTAGELGPEVEPWFTEMQQRGEGVIRYTYEGRQRTLVFRRSPLTGWTYAFGFLGERRPGA